MLVKRFRNIIDSERIKNVDDFLISCEKSLPNIFKFDDRLAYANKLSNLADGIVAINDNQWVGVCLGYFNDNITKQAYISIICSLEFEKNKGLGTILHDSFCDLSRRNGMESICLQVLKDNQRALKFYTKMGYVISADHEKKWLLKKVF